MESLTFYTVFSFRRSLQLLSNGKIPLARLGQSTPHDKSCVAVSWVFLYKLNHIAVVPVQLRVKVSWSHTNRSASVFYLVFFYSMGKPTSWTEYTAQTAPDLFYIIYQICFDLEHGASTLHIRVQRGVRIILLVATLAYCVLIIDLILRFNYTNPMSAEALCWGNTPHAVA